jgi:diguanylate cyclase (GGDEF)-like protein
MKKKEHTTQSLWDIESKCRFSSESIDDLAKTPQLLDQYLKTSIENTFSELLFRLTHEKYSENKAFKLWTAIVKHKGILNRDLGRDVGILIATLDYLTNITGDILSPKIMDDKKIEAAAKVATRDALTGLYMRNVFDYFLEAEISKFFKYNKPLSLIMSDIDNFKDVNDNYGHQKGDEVLKQISKILLQNSRQSDLPARYGGEELAIILAEIPIEKAILIAERLRIQIFQYYKLKTPAVTISIGVSTFCKEMISGHELIKAADKALYAAKESGRNKVVSQSEICCHGLRKEETKNYNNNTSMC